MSLRFNVDIKSERTRRAIEGRVKQVQQKISLDLLSGIVLSTPVDTGRASGNWQVTIGQAATGVIEREDPQGSATIAEGASVIRLLEAFSTLHLTNNLPYIVPLETGTSTQAPQGMVKINIDRVLGGLG